MKTVALLACLAALSGCASTSPLEHQAKVNALRARLPYVTKIGNTHSMETIVVPGSLRLVEAYPYDKLESYFVVVFWPAGYANPVCHFAGTRVGTDSWATHGLNQESDLTNGLGFLLTRQNYIGIVK